MIDLLYLLVKYGYYANLGDISNLMPFLLSLLNGMNDKPSIQASKEETDEFKEVPIACNVVILYCNFEILYSYNFARLVVSRTRKKIDLSLN